MVKKKKVMTRYSPKSNRGMRYVLKSDSLLWYATHFQPTDITDSILEVNKRLCCNDYEIKFTHEGKTITMVSKLDIDLSTNTAYIPRTDYEDAIGENKYYYVVRLTKGWFKDKIECYFSKYYPLPNYCKKQIILSCIEVTPEVYKEGEKYK